MANELEDLENSIRDMEQQLAEMRREYREKSTSALRLALEARKEIDATIRDELKSLGYNSVPAYVAGSVRRYY